MGRGAARAAGRGPRPLGRGQTTPFVGALRMTGLTAPLVLDGPLTTDAFRAYVAHLFVPTLRAGDIVVLDHLAGHKDPVSAQQIAHAGATLKALARGAAHRSREALWASLGSVIPRFSPVEC